MKQILSCFIVFLLSLGIFIAHPAPAMAQYGGGYSGYGGYGGYQQPGYNQGYQSLQAVGSVPNQRAKVGQPFSYQLPSVDILFRSSTLLSGSGLTGLPPGLYDTGRYPVEIAGTPTSAGNYKVTYLATDTQGGRASIDFYINVEQGYQPLQAVGSVPNQRAKVGQPFSYQLPSVDILFRSSTLLSGSGLTGLPPGLYDTGRYPVEIAGTPTSAGNYKVTYLATDAQGGRATIDFYINVEQDYKPLQAVMSIPDQTAKVGQPFYYRLPSEDSAFSYSVRLTSIGLIGDMPPGLTQSAGQPKIVSGTPTTPGRYRLIYLAADALGSEARIEFYIKVEQVNRPPIANNIPDRTVIEGQSITPINLSDAFTDPDGDNLTYSVSGLPAGLNFNPGNKTIAGIPASGTARTYSVTVTVDDGYGHSVSQSFRITVQSGNRPPSYNNKPLPDLTAGTTTNLPIDLNNFFTDPDGDRLSFSNAIGLPDGLTLAANGQITGTPTAAAAAQTQPLAFSVDVSDGKNPTVTQRLTLKVNPQPNKPPSYNNKPLPDLTAGTTTNLPIDLNNFFTDPEGDRLSFSNAVGLPDGLTLAANGQITGTPTAAAAAQTQPLAFSVDVSDGKNPTVTQRLTLKVNPKPNSAPTRNPNFRLPNLTVGVPINPPIDVSNAFTDPDGDRLTYTIDIIDLPASLTFNPNTNQISGIPRRAGTLNIPITVSDRQNPPVTEQFSLTVTK